jgi:hypothetical protein
MSPKQTKTEALLATGAMKLEEKHRKALDAHRWHWVADESNPDRVSVTVYRMVSGVGQKEIWASVDRHSMVEVEEAVGNDPLWAASRISDYLGRHHFPGSNSYLFAKEMVEAHSDIPLSELRKMSEERYLEMRQAKQQADKDECERAGHDWTEWQPTYAADHHESRFCRRCRHREERPLQGEDLQRILKTEAERERNREKWENTELVTIRRQKRRVL